MKHSEYLELYQKLSTPEDIDFLAENFGYSKELLLVIYTQRVTRDATKRYYRVKDQAKRLLRMWQDGQTFVQIARKYDFPPVLTAMMIMEQRKVSRKQFWKLVSDPGLSGDAGLRKDLQQALKDDIVYSPSGVETQYARGRWGEKMLNDWLDARGLQYRTEKQLKSEYDKTPDILLHKPIEWNGSKNYWIESKAIVGDPVEIKRHIRRQLGPYWEIFGDGIVVYWFGYVDDVKLDVPKGISMVDQRFFERDDVVPLPQTVKRVGSS
jgi:hypothetical protein